LPALAAPAQGTVGRLHPPHLRHRALAAARALAAPRDRPRDHPLPPDSADAPPLPVDGHQDARLAPRALPHRPVNKQALPAGSPKRAALTKRPTLVYLPGAAQRAKRL